MLRHYAAMLLDDWALLLLTALLVLGICGGVGFGALLTLVRA